MEKFQEIFLIMLSLFSNLKLMSPSYSWKVFGLQVGDIWKLKQGKAHYDYDYSYDLHFFILCDIWSTVENYFQKILSHKNPLPPKNSKIPSPHFYQHWKFFRSPPPSRKGGGHCVYFPSLMYSGGICMFYIFHET